ncbi:MAG: hypothetical protein ACRELE_04030 [Gemmatimonadales bacterium]
MDVEVTLSHTAPGRIVSATIYCRYLRDCTIEIARLPIDYTIQPTWIASTNVAGWGSRSPGFWQPGSFTVVCDDGRQTLGQQVFEVR